MPAAAFPSLHLFDYPQTKDSNTEPETTPLLTTRQQPPRLRDAPPPPPPPPCCARTHTRKITPRFVLVSTLRPIRSSLSCARRWPASHDERDAGAGQAARARSQEAPSAREEAVFPAAPRTPAAGGGASGARRAPRGRARAARCRERCGRCPALKVPGLPGGDELARGARATRDSSLISFSSLFVLDSLPLPSPVLLLLLSTPTPPTVCLLHHHYHKYNSSRSAADSRDKRWRRRRRRRRRRAAARPRPARRGRALSAAAPRAAVVGRAAGGPDGAV